MKGGRLLILAFIAAVCVTAAVIITFFALDSSEKLPEVQLAEKTAGMNGSGGSAYDENIDNSPVRAELSVETVQYVISSLDKPESYTANYTIENFWKDGSGKAEVSVSVLGDRRRVAQSFGSYSREVLYNDTEYYVWYKGEKKYYHGKRGELTAGEAFEAAVQMSGSYKSLLELDASYIYEADYIPLGDDYCIYVSAGGSELGYISHYYISAETGLLLLNEVYDGDTLVYRLSETFSELSIPDEALFSLPDGKTAFSDE